MEARIEAIRCEPLAVPLRDPFVIASARIEVTQSVLVRVELSTAAGRFEGLGEAASLPPVTAESRVQVLDSIRRVAAALVGTALEPHRPERLDALLDPHLGALPVARSGLEMALLDALAKARGLPVYTLLSGIGPREVAPIVTDITLPILTPERVYELARHWWSLGFRTFKVKVGRALEEDLATLEAIARAAPAARIRADANCGYRAAEALRFLDALRGHGFQVECLEQPCAADDLDGMAEVAAATGIPLVADESVKRLEDLHAVRRRRAADGVNLKVAKSGGMLRALEIGREAKRHGMCLMMGGMVETRLGMTAAAHVAAALGGVEFPDLDTAWLLEGDPFRGGYREQGPTYLLTDEPGLGITLG